MSTLLKELQDKTKEINDIKAKLVAELRPKFAEIFQPAFDKYPELLGFRWTQYTPYFNDGEPCEFRVGDVGVRHPKIEGYYECDSDEDGPKFTYGPPSTWGLDKTSSYYNDYADMRAKTTAKWGSEQNYLDFVADVNAISKAINDLPEDVLQDLFGNHVEIFVDRLGLTVEEYDHD